MTDTILVNLVSEQTIPNVQFIKWYFSKNEKNLKVLFVSTEKMEAQKKSSSIENALESLEKFIEFGIITIESNDLLLANKTFSNYFENNKYKNVIVNITGGTKLMSLSAFEFFKNFPNAEIFYQPIGEPLQKLVPKQEKFDMSELLNLKEYLKANGISFNYTNYCLKDWEYNKNVYELHIKNNREIIAKMVQFQNGSWFKNIYKRKETLDFTEIDYSKFEGCGLLKSDKEQICELLGKLEFDIHKIRNDEFRYATGAWFEEYVYQKICNEYQNVEKENVALNVKIKKGNDENELDVIYLDKENRLHVIECKSFVDGKEGSKVLNDAIYKLQAIVKSKFGLYIKQHLYTKSIVDKESILNRAKDFGIDIKDGSVL